MYYYKSLEAGQLPGQHLSFLHNLLYTIVQFYYQNFFEMDVVTTEALAWMNVAPVASL